jgi:hypothetical protein
MQSERGAAVSTALVDGRVEDMFFCRRVFETRFWVDGKTWQGCVEVVGRIENPGGSSMFSLMSSRILMCLNGASRPDLAKADGMTTCYRLVISR